MGIKHTFTSELPEFVNYYDYATSKLSEKDLADFIAGQGENSGSGSEEHNMKFSYLYTDWLKEYKITHTISDENDQVVKTITYTE
jgi:hypothetical protein